MNMINGVNDRQNRNKYKMNDKEEEIDRTEKIEFQHTL